MEISKDDETNIALMLRSEGWQVMVRLLDELTDVGIDKLRITDPRMNKLEYSEHDIVRATLNIIDKIRQDPYNWIEQVKDVPYNAHAESTAN